jgi:hypothetical protein
MKTDVDSRVVDYFWQENTRRWSAEVRDGRLARVSQFDLENGPTLGQVAASLGVPEFVYGYVGAICEKSCNYSLGLDYPHLGISVYHSGYETTSQLWEMGAPSLAIQGDMRATEILCYEPAPMDTALRQAFGASMDSLTVQMSMRSPWVGFGARVPLGPR